MKCGKELSDENQEYCRDCLHKNICMTEGSAYTGMRALKRRFTGSNMRAGRNTPLFRKRDGMAFGAADPFLEGRRIGPVPLHPARKRKEATIRRSFWHWKLKTVRAPGGEQLADSDKKYSSAEAFKWAGTPK